MPKRKYQQVAKDAMDAGSPMMARHFTIVPKLSSPTTMAMRVLNGSEIDKMLMDDAVTTVEHATLCTLAKKLRDFGYSDLRSPNYESPIHADASGVGDKKADTIRGAVALIGKMDDAMGRFNRKKLINLALYDAPWGNNADALKTCIRAMDNIFNRKT